MDYKIEKHEVITGTYESIKFYAVDKETKKDIFGADVEIFRMKGFDGDWSDWKINYWASGSKDYRTALPFIEVINKAMEALKKKEQGR